MSHQIWGTPNDVLQFKKQEKSCDILRPKLPDSQDSSL
jgi:hypothetical protein